MLSFFRKFKYLDLPLLLAVFLLSLTGLALLYSTSLSSETLVVFKRQIIFVLIGWAFFLFFSFIDYHSVAKSGRLLYILSLLSLVYVLFFGEDIRGGTRWIDVGFFKLQPSEFVKVIIILGLGRILYLQRGQINSAVSILRSFMYAAIPAFLVLMEPDFGSAAVILCLWLGMVFLSPINKKYILGLLAIAFLAAIASWNFLLKDFQKNRIRVFLDPQRDTQGQGYNVRQAVVAVGSGGLWGKGLGLGSQSQNRFLPERQTDFIFAASAEQIGLFGTGAVLGLFLFLHARLINIMQKSRDSFGLYAAGGVFFLSLIHTLVNIGMNIGLLPVTGIPLPFLSAGGSFFIMLMIALGIAQNISLQSKALRF
ncbi:MAG: rod shape-determining protein RodA [Patescibacteria group bacterium]